VILFCWVYSTYLLHPSVVLLIHLFFVNLYSLHRSALLRWTLYPAAQLYGPACLVWSSYNTHWAAVGWHCSRDSVSRALRWFIHKRPPPRLNDQLHSMNSMEAEGDIHQANGRVTSQNVLLKWHHSTEDVRGALNTDIDSLNVLTRQNKKIKKHQQHQQQVKPLPLYLVAWATALSIKLLRSLHLKEVVIRIRILKTVTVSAWRLNGKNELMLWKNWLINRIERLNYWIRD